MTADANRAAAALHDLETSGYAVLRSAVPAAELSAIGDCFARRFASTPFCQGGFYGGKTKRFGRLLIRHPNVAALVEHPIIRTVMDAVLLPACDRLNLNLTQAIELHPGAPAQVPHRDQDLWPGAKGSFEYLVNVMWPLTPFTEANGGTCLWPGSHRDVNITDAEPSIVPDLYMGDALIWLGSTLHGAGANRSEHSRVGVIVSYCLGWLKPFENQWLAYPPAIARHFSTELAALVGYSQHRPNLGNFEGQCPSIVLRDDLPEHIGAIDALSPEQSQALAAYMAEQELRSIP
ncbi:phytanoyl-CoA dioxygenase family protein [Sphingomonas colocasiae]|uniref:Phytanoyl-CoA dioxygenase family protein n=1 Tax=Sphingomonas colocasiae TaxID=1848973 RepID=A0ABS7PJB3_9SPHN|nr:phytanoyl-CoA dioxygenase family protein [Sphingomonas colocasiae]MBY8821059.1 phytanoyl-CoA dioxygenase family protein [Sphingomonas colocasiae]